MISTRRVVRPKTEAQLPQSEFQANVVRTSKYNWWTFVPVCLFNQFRKAANTYFLFIAVLQSIPSISPLSPLTAIAPLVFVIAVSITREFLEDLHRHREDDRVNSSLCRVLRSKSAHPTTTTTGPATTTATTTTTPGGGDGGITMHFESSQWRDLQVGDVVEVRANEAIPADLLLLGSSHEDGVAHIQTMNLDGETNLKFRKPLTNLCAAEGGKDLKELISEYTITADPPNGALDRFDGVWTTSSTSEPLTIGSFLPRDASLKATKQVYGLVVYTGKECKSQMGLNSGIYKMSLIDRMTSRLVLVIILIQTLLCLAAGLVSAVQTSNDGQNMWYVKEALASQAAMEGLQNGLAFFLLLNTMVPISLLVTIEIVKLLQTFFMENDTNMFYTYRINSSTTTTATTVGTTTGATTTGNVIGSQEIIIKEKCRTSALNEDLGMIGYIMSDKTGTLTANELEFRQCWLNTADAGGCRLGEQQSAEEALRALAQKGELVASEVVRLLATCHEVTPDEEAPGTFAGESPDEVCLVETAARLGLKLKKRDGKVIILENSLSAGGSVVEDKLMVGKFVAFTNGRKRSSVLLRFATEFVLYTKGADDVMLNLLERTPRNLEVCEEELRRFSRQGLRTLVLARRRVGLKEGEQWLEEMRQAEIIEDERVRVERVAEVVAKMESEMELLGISATEDKLQEYVPETIEHLRQAKIAVWMITGDKLETAIEIGKSCRLIKPDVDVYAVVDDRNLLSLARPTAEGGVKPKLDCVVVTGGSLERIFAASELKAEFRRLAMSCKTVICCRSSKEQKAQIVELVKSHTKLLTLAVGDGANDVAMIRKAHVGVGVFGKEGRQAVQNADYAIGRFHHLERLILFHGRLNYMRVSLVVLYFFFKNLIFTMSQFYFGFSNFWSGSTYFNDYYITFYNLIFTALPAFVLGTLEKDVDPQDALLQDEDRRRNYAKLYYVGRENRLFNARTIISVEIVGAAISALVYTIGQFGIDTGIDGTTVGTSQWVSSQLSYSLVVGLALGAVIFGWSESITAPLVVSVLYSYVLYFSFVWSSNYYLDSYMTGSTMELFSHPSFYLAVPLVFVLVLGAIAAVRVWRHTFHPTAKTAWIGSRKAAKRARASSAQ